MIPRGGKISGALKGLSGFGARLSQQEGQAKPGLADLARKVGKGGVEQTGQPVEVKARDVEPDEIHPLDKTYSRKPGSKQWKKRTVSTTGKKLPPVK
jgi:hypothetical protein